jgi:hypothetical protein
MGGAEEGPCTRSASSSSRRHRRGWHCKGITDQIPSPSHPFKANQRVANASHWQHNPFVYNNMIYGEKILPAFDQSCRMQRRSRYFVTNNGYREELLQHFAACDGTVKVHCSRCPSICNYGN